MQLVSNDGLSWPHDWSHDGDKILFAGQRDGIWNIYWVSRSTKEQKQLTHYSKLNAFVRYPAWSPAGNQIVYEYAETTVAQRISMVDGVAQVQVFGSTKYAVRVQVDPNVLAARGIGLNEVDAALRDRICRELRIRLQPAVHADAVHRAVVDGDECRLHQRRRRR